MLTLIRGWVAGPLFPLDLTSLHPLLLRSSRHCCSCCAFLPLTSGPCLLCAVENASVAQSRSHFTSRQDAHFLLSRSSCSDGMCYVLCQPSFCSAVMVIDRPSGPITTTSQPRPLSCEWAQMACMVAWILATPVLCLGRSQTGSCSFRGATRCSQDAS